MRLTVYEAHIRILTFTQGLRFVVSRLTATTEIYSEHNIIIQQIIKYLPLVPLNATFLTLNIRIRNKIKINTQVNTESCF